MSVVAGVDFGTSSVRVSIVHDGRGRLGSGTAPYPVLRRADLADYAAQSPVDHARALEQAFAAALAAARVSGGSVAALAVDTTGSTVIPVDERLRPLGDFYLWCDHRASREAAEITAAARRSRLPALDWCGGAYSSEWGFAKVLHWLRSAPDAAPRFHLALEHCDYVVAMLCGIEDATALPRSVCALGHKWLWNAELGGLPSEDFFAAVDPLLAGLRTRMTAPAWTSDRTAGGLSPAWAARLGLAAGIPVAVGALDAHWDAIGVGCRLGDVVNVVGTSSCLMAVSDEARPIPGVAGVVRGSIHPQKIGIEAGLAAVGDLFAAIAARAGRSVDDLTAALQTHRAGQTGLLRIPWDNGDRSVLADPELTGVTLGWRLNHTAADELFAAIEGTAMQTRIILERLGEQGVPLDRVIHAGGIPQRNALLNRVYAGVLGKPVLVPATDATSLGAAMFAFLAAGTFKTIEAAQAALAPTYVTVEPDPGDVAVYDALYGRFREAYFLLGSLERGAGRGRLMEAFDP
jgi:L-ribulokinase